MMYRLEAGRIGEGLDYYCLLKCKWQKSVLKKIIRKGGMGKKRIYLLSLALVAIK